jgi:uncharacterized protein (TIGR02270 family)
MSWSSATVIVEIVEQHAEEAAFLWGRRDAATQQPHFSLSELARLDERVEAHVDGLRIAGDTSWEICKDTLKTGGAGEVFAAAVLAFGRGTKNALEAVWETGTASPGLSRGLVSALGWLSLKQVNPHIKQLLISTTVPPFIGIAASAIHRKNPGETLLDAMRSEDLWLQTRACKAVGELGRLDLVPVLIENLNTDDKRCRFSAAWSAALLSGDETAVHILQSIAESGQPRAEQALQMAVRRMDPSSAHTWQTRLASEPKSMRSAAIAAGAIGDSVLVPWLISLMADPALARVSGEAFSAITGVDIAYADLDGEKPEGFEADPTDDPKDENVEMDPDENLPWPDRAAIENWWDKRGSDFTPGVRHLLGKPITAEWLEQVLRIGRQRQRAAAALELALRNPGQPLFNVKSPGFRQQQLLGIGRR